MKSFIGQKVSEISDKIEDMKQQVLTSILKEKGIEIDWEKEKDRRFKSLTVEHYNNTGTQQEVYFYNDGSIEGLRVVTFELNFPIATYGVLDGKFNLKLNWY